MDNNSILKLSVYLFILCMCVVEYMPKRSCGSLRGHCWSQFSHPIMWVPGTELMSSGFVRGAFSTESSLGPDYNVPIHQQRTYFKNSENIAIYGSYKTTQEF